jgi:O-antigen/teichoic acid export membrane protein
VRKRTKSNVTAQEQPASRSLRQIAAKSASATFVANGLTQVLTLATYTALARLTTPRVFGVFGAATILLAAGELFMESGMTAALVQRRTEVRAAASTAFLAALVGGVCLALAAFGGSVVVGAYFHNHQIGLVAAALSGTVAVNSASVVPIAFLQRRLSPLRFVVAEPAAAVAFGIGSGLGLAYGLGVWGLVLGAYCWSVTRTAALWLLVRWRPRPRSASWQMWRELAGYGRHIVATELLREITRVATTALVGRFLGTASLGEFRFGSRLAIQASGPILHANAQVVFPAVADAEEHADVKRRSLVSLRLVTLVAFPVSAFFFALGQPLALVLFGEEWKGVGLVLVALAAVPAGQAIDSVASEIWKARARPDILPRMHALNTAITVGLLALLVHTSAAGAAAAFSVSAIVVALYAIRRLSPIIGVSTREIGSELLPALGSAGVAGLVTLMSDRALSGVLPATAAGAGMRVAIGCVIGSVIYLLLLTLFSRVLLREAGETLRALRSQRHVSTVRRPDVDTQPLDQP